MKNKIRVNPIKWLLRQRRNFIYYSCKGYWSESNTDHPSEFDCDAENGGEVSCDNCLCNGGMYNPDTGKKDYIRYFLIEFDRWLKNLFRKCRNCKHSICVFGVIPEWRCKILGKNIMIEPNGCCEYWRVDR